MNFATKLERIGSPELIESRGLEVQTEIKLPGEIMTILKRFTIFLLLYFQIFYCFQVNGATCNSFLSAPNIISLAPVSDAQLPPEYIARILENSAVHRLRMANNLGFGKKFFNIYSFTGSINSGEALQSSFVEKVMKVILPDAMFLGIQERREITDRMDLIEFRVEDPAVLNIDYQEKLVLQMAKVKLANPGPVLQSRIEIKKVIGIAPDHKGVVTLTNSQFSDEKEFIDLIDILLETGRSSLIIVSDNRFSRDLRYRFRNSSDVELVKLTEIRGSPPKQNKVVIAENDSRGRLPYVYAASDLVVIAGPVNIGEPIVAGTELIFFGPESQYMRRYETAVFTDMANVVRRSSQATQITDKSELSATVKQSLLSPQSEGGVNPLPLYLLDDGFGTTTIDSFLNHLVEKVTEAGL